MPQVSISQSIAPGALVDLATNLQYQYLPWPARVKLLIRAPVATLRLQVFSGSETIQEESPIQSGGVAGVTPSELNTPPIIWDAAAGDKLGLRVRSTDAAAQTVDAVLYYFPL